MARYINNLLLNKPADFVAFMMNDYLQKNGFSMADYKGQPAAAPYGQPAGMPGGAPNAQPGSYPAGAPVPVQTVDNSGPAVWALVFGVLSVLTCLFLPYFSIIFSVLGVNKARLSGGSSKAGVAKIGQVLSIIGAAIAAVMLVYIFINAIIILIK